jgi:hypothetical protein
MMAQPVEILVINPFSGYVTGAIITDSLTITAIWNGADRDNVVALAWAAAGGGPAETLTAGVTTALTGIPLSLAGIVANGTPSALDYSLDLGQSWAAVGNFALNGGNWTGTGPLYSAAQSGRLRVRDHAAPSIMSVDASFTVTQPPSTAGTLTLADGSQVTGIGGGLKVGQGSAHVGLLAVDFGTQAGMVADGGAVAAALGVAASAQGSVSAASSLIGSINSEIVTINANLGTVTTQIGTITGQITTLNSQIAASDQQFGSIDGQIGSLNNQIGVAGGIAPLDNLGFVSPTHTRAFGVDTLTSLRNIAVAAMVEGVTAFVGYNGGNTTPIGGGTFKFHASSTAADDGVMTIMPASAPAAGRWLRAADERMAINVLWCGAVASDTVDNTAAFTLARSIANIYACPIYVPPGRYKLNWNIADNADLWMIGEGTILWAEAVTPITVTRQAGTAIALSGLAPVTIGVVSGNSYVDEAATLWTLQGIAASAVPGIQAGQIYHLNSQDIYPWALSSIILGSGTGTVEIWQGQLVRVQGICIPFSGGTGGFAEDQIVTGAVSGAVAQIRSVSGTTSGYIIVSSLTAAFSSGENLLVAGSVMGQCSGAAVVAIGEKIVDSFATSPQIQLLTPCKTIIDGLTIDVPAGSNVEQSVGQANRLPGIILGLCIEPRVKNITCITGWTRFLQSLGCWQGDYEVAIKYLPDDANLTEAAYGYGVELAGPDTGARVKVLATGCRHAFTTNVFWGGYSYMGLPLRGNPRGFLVYGSEARDCYNAGFDTHWGCYEGRFENCRSDYAAHVNRNVSASIGFQNRGYNTVYSGCEAVGCVNGFVDSYQNLGSPAPPAGQPVYQSTTYYAGCQAVDYQLNGFVVPVSNTSTYNKQQYQNCVARGDGRSVNAPYYQSAYNYAYASNVRMIACTAERFNGTPIQIAGAGGRIELADFYAYYRDNPNTTSGVKFNGAPAEVYVSNFRVMSDVTTSSPAGLFRNAVAGTMAIGLSGFIGSVNRPSTPVEDPSDTGSINFVWSIGRNMQTSLTAAGSTQATAFPITGQVNTFTNVAAGQGAILSAPYSTTLPNGLAIGSDILVFNRGTNALQLYPPSGAQIESNAVNAPVSIAAGSQARLTVETASLFRLG